MKHNKKRNTAFIYEALARAITKSIIDKDVEAKAKLVGIIKEFFRRGTILSQEMELYGVLLQTVNMQRPIAERLLQETKTAYARLDERSIFKAQSQLIAAINKGLGQAVWSTFIPNFKALASVNAIFGEKTSVKKRVLFEENIIDKMSTPLVAAQLNELKPLDNLTYNSFIKKFNEKYASLLQEQKDLLSRYITSFSDDGLELRVYLNQELDRLKGNLREQAKSEQSPLLSQKTEQVLEYIEGFRKREFTDADIKKVLKTQELVQELTTHD